MGLIPFPQFIGPSYKTLSINAASEDLINYYPESIESPTAGSPNRVWMIPTPGFATVTSGLRGSVRGLFFQDGRCFAVAGDALYELDGNFNATLLANVGNDDQPASMASNGHSGNQLLIISAGDGYILNLTTNVVAPITSTNFPDNALMCDFMDGYFIVLQSSTSNFYVSALEDGFAWSGDVGQASSFSDNLMAIRVIHRNLWLVGSLHTEVWENVGDVFPFAPIPGALSEYGTQSPWTVTEALNSIIMLGQSERGATVVLQSDGYDFKEINTYPVSVSLADQPDLAEIVAFTYEEEGHTFFQMSFGDVNGPTWAYDMTEGLWHQRGVWNSGLDVYEADRPTCHCYGFNRHLVGDRLTGSILDMSLGYATNDGLPIRRQRTAPHINQQRQWMFYQQFQIDMETGLGTNTEPDPIVMLQWSKDGGHTFSQPLPMSYGAVGEYAKQVKWTRAGGRARDMVYRLTTNSLVPPRLLSAYLRVEPGSGES